MAATDYDYVATRNQLIERAFRLIGASPLGVGLSAEQYVQGVQALQQRVKSLQTRRIYLWSLQTQTKTLTPSTASYAFPTDPAIVAIDRAFIRVSNIDHPVEVISWRAYNDIPDKTATGQPTQVAVDGNRNYYLYPTPNSAYTLFYLGVVRLKDFDSASGSGDEAVSFQNALTYQLASDLADEYRVPLQERAYLSSKADDFFLEAAKNDRDKSDMEFVEGAFRD